MRRKNIFGIVGLFILTVLLTISCDLFGNNNPFKGTWVSRESYTVTFEDSTWRLPRYSQGEGLRGTYTFTDSTATITYTEITLDTEITSDGTIWRRLTPEEASRYTRTATISGNTLTWGITTYTRR